MAAVGQDPPSIVRLAGLDGLRGLALVGILAFHAGVLPGGFLAVDTFFALSGFLITTLLLRESAASENGTIDLFRFWRRRLRRLAPGLLALLAGLALVALVMGDAGPLGGSRASALATFTYVANWYAIGVGQGYWDRFGAPSPLGHMWTLAVEEQFYLLWPAILAVALRAIRRVPLPQRCRLISAGCVAGAAASAGWMAWLYRPDEEPSRVYLGTDTRAYALLLGAALASWWLGREPPRRHTTHPATASLVLTWFDVVSVGALALLLLFWTFADGVAPWLYRGGMALLSLPAVLVVAAAARPASLVTRLLSVRPLRWLGQISYGAYLWHWPWFIAVRAFWPELALPLRLILQLTGALAAGVASFVFIERPFQKHGVRRWGAPSRALVGFALTGLLLVLATTPDRVARTAAPTADAALSTPIPGPNANAVVGAIDDPAAAARSGPERSRRRVLVVGDSVGYRLGEELTRSAESRNLVALNRATPGCFLGRGTGRVRYQETVIEQEPAVCATWSRRWAADVAAFHPDLVLVVSGNAGDGEREFDGRWHGTCTDSFARWLADELVDAARVLGAQGADVVVTTVPYPRFPFLDHSLDPSTDCMNRIITSAPASITTPAASSGSVRVVDLARWVCPSADSCITVVDGDRLRPDGVHFEGSGAVRALDWLLREADPRP